MASFQRRVIGDVIKSSPSSVSQLKNCYRETGFEEYDDAALLRPPQYFAFKIIKHNSD